MFSPLPFFRRSFRIPSLALLAVLSLLLLTAEGSLTAQTAHSIITVASVPSGRYVGHDNLGNLYVAGTVGGKFTVYQVTPSTVGFTTTVVYTESNGATLGGFDVSADGTLFYILGDSHEYVSRTNGTYGTPQHLLDSFGQLGPGGVAVERGSNGSYGTVYRQASSGGGRLGEYIGYSPTSQIVSGFNDANNSTTQLDATELGTGSTVSFYGLDPLTGGTTGVVRRTFTSANDTNIVTEVVHGLSSPRGMGSDPYNNILYIANSGAKSIVSAAVTANSNVTPTLVATLPFAPEDVTYEPNGRLLYALDPAGSLVAIAAPLNFSTINLGATSPTQTITFVFDTTGTVLPAVLTRGVANLDFVDAGTGTCTTNGTGRVYQAGDTCTVDVQFSPRAAGLRRGSVELVNGNGGVAATAYVSGTGVGPQLNYSSPAPIGIQNGTADAITVDGGGNVLYFRAGALLRIAYDGATGAYGAPVLVANVGGTANSMTLDGAGNVFIGENGTSANNGFGSILYVPFTTGYGQPVAIASLGGNQTIAGLAAGANGDLYYANTQGNLVGRIVRNINGTFGTPTTLFTVQGPTALALDAAGTVYFASSGANGNTIGGLRTNGNDFQIYTAGAVVNGLSVEANGSVLFSSAGTLYRIANNAGTYGQPVALAQLSGGFARDGAGNVFAVASTQDRIIRIPFATPPTLAFGQAAVNSTTPPQVVTVSNVGNANLVFPPPGAGMNPSISSPFLYNASSTCPQLGTTSAAGTLGVAASCTASVSYAPTAAGTSAGQLVFTDNNLNVNGTQTIPLSGTAFQLAMTPAAGALAPASYQMSYSQTFTATGGTGSGFTYALTSGNLPTGLSLSTAGVLSGSPVQVGSFAFAVTATDQGNTNLTVTQNYTLQVNPASVTVTVSSPSVVYGTASTTLTASVAYSVTTPPTGASSFTVNGTTLPATCTGSSSPITCTATYNSSAVAAGQYAIVFTIAADANYATGTGNGTLTVTKASPVLAWTKPAAITYGTALSATQLNATATYNGNAVAGTFTYTPPAGTVLNAGPNQTLAATFVPTDTTDYNTSGQPVTTTITVNPATAVITFTVPNHTYGDAPFTVGASSASTGAFTYSVVSGPATISGNTVTLTGAGTVTLQASQAADANYVANTKQSSFTVAPGTAAITFTVPNHTYGDAPFTVSASSASTGAFTYTVVSGPATISGNTVTLTGAGTVTLQASQAADANYAANTKQTSFTVAAGSSTIRFTAPNHTYGDAPFTVSASSASTGAFTYSVVSGPATISGNTVTLTGAGTVVLRASQAADANYAANSTTATFTVSPATTVLTYPQPAPVVYGTALGSSQLNATATAAGLGTVPGTFTYSPAAGTVPNAGTVTITVQFTPSNPNNFTTPAAVSTTLTVTQAPTTTVVTTSASPVLERVPVTFTATVRTTAGGTTPTGTVTFLDGTTTLGTATLNASGVATFTVAGGFTGAGNRTITATYAGNANQAGSSGTVTQAVGSAATLVLTDAGQGSFSVAVQRGLAAQTTVTLTPGATFAGTVQFSCAGQPANVSCTFTPSSVTVAQGSGAQSITLLIRSASLQLASLHRGGLADERTGSGLLLAFTLPGMLVAGVGARSRKLRGSQRLLLLLFCVSGLTAMAGLAGCGSGSTPLYTTNNAAAGTYTFNVVATSGSTTVSLPVLFTIQ